MARVHSETRTVTENAFAADRQLKDATDALSTHLSRFNAEAARLQIAPAGAKYSGGADFSLTLDSAFLASIGPAGAVVPEAALAALMSAGGADDTMNASIAGAGTTAVTASAATTAALLGNDVKGTVKPGLREIRARLARAAADTAASLRELDERVTSTADARRDVTRRSEALARRISEKDAAVEAHRAELDAGLTGSQRRMDDVEAAVTAARAELADAQAAALELSPDALRAVEITVSTQLAALEARRRGALGTLHRLLAACHEHKYAISERLEELVARATAKRERLTGAAPLRAPAPGARAVSSHGAVESTRAAGASISAALPLMPAPPAASSAASHVLFSAGPATLPPPPAAHHSTLASSSTAGGALPAPPVPTPLGMRSSNMTQQAGKSVSHVATAASATPVARALQLS